MIAEGFFMITLIQTIFSYPQVWIGIILAVVTLNGDTSPAVYDVFFKVGTYQSLAILVGIYTLIFDKQYKAGRKGIDIPATLFNLIVSMYVILLVWGLGVFAVVTYLQSGEAYGEVIRKKYKQGQYERQLERPSDTELKELQFLEGQKYHVIPKADGSFVVEILEK